MANKGPTLLQSQFLNGDDYLLSPNGLYVAIMQDDGNFVLYHATSTQPPNPDWSRPYWATNTGGVGQGFAIMQNDGNFVLYHGTSSNPGAPYWASNTNAGAGSYHLDLQSDGNLVLYHASWASNTVAGVGANLTILSGNDQTQPLLSSPGGWLPVNFGPLSVALKDNIGDPLSGKQITWSVSSHPAGMVVQLASTTTTTDSNGIATLNSVQATYVDGAFTVVASYGSASVTFNLTVGGLSTTIVAGNNQSVARTQDPNHNIPIAYFAPLQVKVVYAATGQPASGAVVNAYVGNAPGMVVVLQPGVPGFNPVATTDSNGIATFNTSGGYSMCAYYASGPFTVIVNTMSGHQVTFNETVSS